MPIRVPPSSTTSTPVSASISWPRHIMFSQSKQIRTALSLIEVIASTMIVGMMAVATLNALGAATKSSDSIGNRAIAAGLADELMSEIVQQPYSDPDGS